MPGIRSSRMTQASRWVDVDIAAKNSLPFEYVSTSKPSRRSENRSASRTALSSSTIISKRWRAFDLLFGAKTPRALSFGIAEVVLLALEGLSVASISSSSQTKCLHRILTPPPPHPHPSWADAFEGANTTKRKRHRAHKNSQGVCHRQAPARKLEGLARPAPLWKFIHSEVPSLRSAIVDSDQHMMSCRSVKTTPLQSTRKKSNHHDAKKKASISLGNVGRQKRFARGREGKLVPSRPRFASTVSL